MVSRAAITSRKELQYNSMIFRESDITVEGAMRSIKECDAFESHAEKWKNENAFALAGLKNEEAAFMCKAVLSRALSSSPAAYFMDLYAKHSAKAAQFYDLAAHEIIGDRDLFKSEGSPYSTGSITSRFYSASNYFSMASKWYADAGDNISSEKFAAQSKLCKLNGVSAELESMPLWKLLRLDLSAEESPDRIAATKAISEALAKKLEKFMRNESAENGDKKR